MFCKRCDGAYHCYCQHPPHKNISSGPYLCPKHTRCHSCGSNVPGNGLSVRWFQQYTCCDTCGRLFVKGNYCPVCLKTLHTHVEGQSSSINFSKDNNNDAFSGRGRIGNSIYSITGVSLSHAQGVCSINQPGVLKHKFMEEVTAGTDDQKSRVVQIKSSKPPSMLNIQAPRRIMTSIISQNIGEKHDMSGQGTKDREKEGNLSKFEKVFSRNTVDRGERSSAKRTRLVFRKGNATGKTPASEVTSSVKSPGTDKVSPGMHMVSRQDLHSEIISEPSQTAASQNTSKDSKPLLKLKFKNISRDSSSSQLPPWDEEKSSIKGQRSKRKRPSPILLKSTNGEDCDASQSRRDYLVDEIVDANWILKKLGKDAIGKWVEIHQATDKTWHKGVVTEVIEGTSMLSVDLDDGRATKVELGTQGVRIVSQKQKSSKL